MQFAYYTVALASGGGALVVAVVFNCALLCLVRWQTPPELRIYSGLLVQTCVTDLLLTVYEFLMLPVSSRNKYKIKLE
jgi:hypothetical protein